MTTNLRQNIDSGTRWFRMNYEHQKKALRRHPQMCFISGNLLSVPFITALLHPHSHTPQHHHSTHPHKHTHMRTLSEMEDIAMMGTKARWKLRPDITSNLGLITAQYIKKCVCVCVLYFGSSQPFLPPSVHTNMHATTQKNTHSIIRLEVMDESSWSHSNMEGLCDFYHTHLQIPLNPSNSSCV